MCVHVCLCVPACSSDYIFKMLLGIFIKKGLLNIREKAYVDLSLNSVDAAMALGLIIV